LARITVIVGLPTGDEAALYFQSSAPFISMDDCQKSLKDNADKLRDVVKSQTPATEIKLFGNCQPINQPQDMMPLLGEEEQQDDENSLPQL
jgi:hypothetical protein